MKDKRRNTEKRKEKSRDAARYRRSKESEVFNELARCLPMQSCVISQLDKASVMRLSISFLKIQHILSMHQWSDDKKKAGVQGMLDHLFPKALDGFVFILSREGDVVYVNDSVVKYLGIQQIELMGQSIFDFCDPRDEDEIREAVSVRSHSGKHTHADSEDRVFVIRLKCTLTSKGRNVNLKSASYKVIRCRGHMVVPSHMRRSSSFPYLMCVGEPVPHPANIEVPLGHDTFLSKHDMDLKFTYCDDKVHDLLNYSMDDLLGSSLLDYHHAGDSEVVDGAYKDLLSKGQMVTGHYRFLVKGGGWAWVMTQATVIQNSRNHKAQWVVCVHHVLSQVEHGDLILSQVQRERDQMVMEIPQRLMRCTESIFSPKTADMDQGYFIPPHMRNTVKMAKSNEPEDLTYLAPTAGDSGMPLELPFCFQGLPSSHSDSSLRKEEVDLTSPHPPVVLEGLKQEPGLSPPLCHPPAHDWHASALSSTRSPSASSLSPSSSCSSRMSSPRDYVSMSTPRTFHSLQLMDQFFCTLEMKCESSKEDIDVQRYNEIDRAPYIPMTTSEDQLAIPPSLEAIYSVQKDINPALQGKTEYIFRSKTSNTIFDDPMPPPRPNLRDMIHGSTAVASIEQPEDIMLKQIKRSLDMNSLEKGPPPRKLQCRMGHGGGQHHHHHHHDLSHHQHHHQQQQEVVMPHLPPLPPPLPLPQLQQQQQQLLQVPADKSQKMLLNLLMTGDDLNGFRTSAQGPRIPQHKGGSGTSGLINPLLCLTQHDCDVNAPIQSGPLLDGDDLLTALEIVMPQTPHPSAPPLQ